MVDLAPAYQTDNDDINEDWPKQTWDLLGIPDVDALMTLGSFSTLEDVRRLASGIAYQAAPPDFRASVEAFLAAHPISTDKGWHPQVIKGEEAGHPFRGNQYEEGESGPEKPTTGKQPRKWSGTELTLGEKPRRGDIVHLIDADIASGHLSAAGEDVTVTHVQTSLSGRVGAWFVTGVSADGHERTFTMAPAYVAPTDELRVDLSRTDDEARVPVPSAEDLKNGTVVYHATGAENVASIRESGFSLRAGVGAGSNYGNAIYAAFSPEETRMTGEGRAVIPLTVSASNLAEVTLKPGDEENANATILGKLGLEPRYDLSTYQSYSTRQLVGNRVEWVDGRLSDREAMRERAYAMKNSDISGAELRDTLTHAGYDGLIINDQTGSWSIGGSQVAIYNPADAHPVAEKFWRVDVLLKGVWRPRIVKEIQAAKVALLDDLGRILLGEREDGRGWDLPGGHIEAGETPGGAALRETDEEVGLTIEVKRELGLYDEGRCIVYEATIVSGQPFPDGAEMVNVEWFAPDALPNQLFAPIAQAIQDAVKIEKGEAEGHPFRGNQWETGESGTEQAKSEYARVQALPEASKEIGRPLEQTLANWSTYDSVARTRAAADKICGLQHIASPSFPDEVPSAVDRSDARRLLNAMSDPRTDEVKLGNNAYGVGRWGVRCTGVYHENDKYTEFDEDRPLRRLMTIPTNSFDAFKASLGPSIGGGTLDVSVASFSGLHHDALVDFASHMGWGGTGPVNIGDTGALGGQRVMLELEGFPRGIMYFGRQEIITGGRFEVLSHGPSDDGYTVRLRQLGTYDGKGAFHPLEAIK